MTTPQPLRAPIRLQAALPAASISAAGTTARQQHTRPRTWLGRMRHAWRLHQMRARYTQLTQAADHLTVDIIESQAALCDVHVQALRLGRDLAAAGLPVPPLPPDPLRVAYIDARHPAPGTEGARACTGHCREHCDCGSYSGHLGGNA